MCRLYILLCFLACSPTVFAQQQSFVEHVEKAKKCVYRVETKDSVFLGTAFSINRYGDFLTCFHVAVPNGVSYDSLYLRSYILVNAISASDTVETAMDARFSSVIRARIPNLDVAVLHVDTLTSGVSFFAFLGLAGSDDIREGQEVALCAFIPDDFTVPRAFVSKGIVSTIRRQVYDPGLRNSVDLIQLDLTAARGTSGGPVFLASLGRVVAMQDAGIFDTGRAVQTPYPIALTMTQIARCLDSLKIPYDMK